MPIADWIGAWSGLRDGNLASAAMTGAIKEPPPPLHPYYPLGVAIPNYEANSATVPALLMSLGGLLASVMLLMGTLARRVNPSLPKSKLAVFCWFVLCKYQLERHPSIASCPSVYLDQVAYG